MKKLLAAMFVALLMVGCGGRTQKQVLFEEFISDPSVPAAISCIACGKPVSKKTEKCLQCGHPALDSVVAFRKEQALVRIRTEEERQQAEIRAEEERKLAVPEEELRRAEEFDQKYGKSIAAAIDYIKIPADYTGWAKKIYDNGQIEWLKQYKAGKQDGLRTAWYENGKKKSEITWKDGKPHGPAVIWHENGQKKSVLNWKDGWPDGLRTVWYENGQKKTVVNWKDGKFMSAEAWKPNGENCPVTNLKDGNGVAVMYEDDGTESFRTTYKDGEIVKR